MSPDAVTALALGCALVFIGVVCRYREVSRKARGWERVMRERFREEERDDDVGAA